MGAISPPFPQKSDGESRHDEVSAVSALNPFTALTPVFDRKGTQPAGTAQISLLLRKRKGSSPVEQKNLENNNCEIRYIIYLAIYTVL